MDLSLASPSWRVSPTFRKRIGSQKQTSRFLDGMDRIDTSASTNLSGKPPTPRNPIDLSCSPTEIDHTTNRWFGLRTTSISRVHCWQKFITITDFFLTNPFPICKHEIAEYAQTARRQIRPKKDSSYQMRSLSKVEIRIMASFTHPTLKNRHTQEIQSDLQLQSFLFGSASDFIEIRQQTTPSSRESPLALSDHTVIPSEWYSFPPRAAKPAHVLWKISLETADYSTDKRWSFHFILLSVWSYTEIIVKTFCRKTQTVPYLLLLLFLMMVFTICNNFDFCIVSIKFCQSVFLG